MFGLGPVARDAQFFDAFTQHAGKSHKAATLLVEMFTLLAEQKTNPYGHESSSSRTLDPVREMVEKINQLEHDGDTLTHQTMKHLHETWITPIDREDIHNLISRLDDVLDLTEAVAERVLLFELSAARPEVLELAKTLETGCKSLARAMELLPTLKKPEELLSICVEVHGLENAADKVYRRALADLFSPGNDPLMVMKWRDILESLESATDRCEDVANIIEGIVLEYA